jgi:hypothetical protein
VLPARQAEVSCCGIGEMEGFHASHELFTQRCQPASESIVDQVVFDKRRILVLARVHLSRLSHHDLFLSMRQQTKKAPCRHQMIDGMQRNGGGNGGIRTL